MGRREGVVIRGGEGEESGREIKEKGKGGEKESTRIEVKMLFSHV